MTTTHSRIQVAAARLAALLLVAVSPWAGLVTAADAPNIVWITAEDMSPTLGCYGDTYATTPNIDALAARSTRYTHAFATAPVCSPSRACLINGTLATTQGTHPMRSEFPLPPEMLGFPKWLRDAGYYTTNNVKTDYNSEAAERITRASWDDCSGTAHWRGREGDAPFFAVFNFMTSHQSRTMVWPYEQFRREVQSQLSPAEIHDPDDAPVPPYYPDTPLVRRTLARYYDCVTVMDKQVGEVLDQLDQDGLDDETIVFFYSDHGSGMPRHKRALFDSGMHVPLLIRFPEKYRHWAPAAVGGTTDRLVCFEDFGPTVLSLAGIGELPAHMHGQPFLGPLAEPPRRFVFGHRDRVDEVIDLSRSVRSRDYLYIRNYMPHLGWNQQTAWCDQAEVREDFYALARSGRATPAQSQYLSPSRPREALFDCNADPLNLNNLIESSAHAKVAERHRRALREHLVESNDLGFVPEIELWRQTGGLPPMRWAERRTVGQRESLLDAASLVGSDDFAGIARLLRDSNAPARYWGAVACSAADSLPENLAAALVKATGDESPAVRIEAAGALGRHGRMDAATAPLLEELEGDDRTVILHAARTIELLGDPRHRGPMQALQDRFAATPGDLAWFIRFSTTGYLSRLPGA